MIVKRGLFGFVRGVVNATMYKIRGGGEKLSYRIINHNSTSDRCTWYLQQGRSRHTAPASMLKISYPEILFFFSNFDPL